MSFNKKEIIDIINILKNTYPDAKCSLNFSTPFELTVAVILSAQCTDERVNLVTPTLFSKYSTPTDFTKIDTLELENIIHSCGFYKNKAKNIKLTAQKIMSDFNGQVPQTMEELLSLPGVGRKTANVILLEIFDISQGIAVDTHVKRLSNRIGFSKETTPEKIEQDLIKLFPQELFKEINHLLIYHGRNICTSRNPKCEKCPINMYCKHYVNK